MEARNNVAKDYSKASKGIRKKVKNSESIALQRYKIDSYVLLDLDKVLNDVYNSLRPVSSDYDTRKELVKCLNAMALDIYGNSKDNCPVLEAYGSFVMDMFSPLSDLDVSINFGNKTSEVPRDMSLQILRRFAEKLRSMAGRGHVRNVDTIFSARVPIVKFVDSRTSIECDLSVENQAGILNSQIIHIISQIDDRFQKLCMLVKHWAKAHEVNSALHRTLNSVSLTLLVAFHLQTQDPPILPPFSVLFKDGIDPPSVEKTTKKFLNWGKRNQESLGRLFATFFIKLQSVEFLWRQGLDASVMNGLWMSKKKCKKGGAIGIEDFTDVEQNVARRVNDEGAKRIYSSINKTIEDLFEFLNGKTAGTRLIHELFVQKTAAEPPPPHVLPLNNYRNGFNDPHEEQHNKRVRLENGHRAIEREEERYDHLRGKRIRYDGNRNGFEEFNRTSGFGNHMNSRVIVNGGANGHLVHHRHDGGRFSGEEPMHMGMWQDYIRTTDLPPPPAQYDRACYEYFVSRNFPQPYSSRPFNK